MSSVPKRADPTLLSSHSISSSTAHLAAWWAISDPNYPREKKGEKNTAPVNDFYILFPRQFNVFVCFGEFLHFQERRGEGLKRKPTKLKNRCMQCQLGRGPFSRELCKQWAQKVTELAVSSTNHPSETIIVILLCPEGLVPSTRADTWGTLQQLCMREFTYRSSINSSPIWSILDRITSFLNTTDTGSAHGTTGGEVNVLQTAVWTHLVISAQY